MNLATRCTECGTVFRVVQDQLKVSEGWVRCGRCTAVFNAQAHLFDLDAPPDAPQAVPPAAPFAAAAQGRDPQADPTPNDPDDWSPTLPVHEAAAEMEQALDPGAVIDVTTAELEHATDHAQAPRLPAAPAGDLPLQDAPMSTEGSPDVIIDIGEPDTQAHAVPVQIDADETAVTPSFMRNDTVGSPLARPAVKTLLLVAALVLAVALMVQAAIAWRDQLAAQVPALRPVLNALCQGLNCRISPLRRIDRLAVESSGLTRIEGAPLHRLSVTLRNRADTAVMAPALELGVTDTQGKLVARKVLLLADLGVNATTIEAGAELPLQALLNTGDRRVAGYTVELFYP
ncbi:MAG: DUF3426 domain-containing protein [Ideonella sp.]|nr:DUF3426 domain-containing protein [Ideonella sp.]